MPWPVIQGSSTTTSWEELAAAVGENQNALKQLRELMKQPPTGVTYTLKGSFELAPLPNLVDFRIGAQLLQAAATSDLHRGDPSSALQDILAVNGFTILYGDDPGLVSLMIRIAILGIANDLCWDALQAKGWSDQQLERLQSACEAHRELLGRLPLTFARERAFRLHELEVFRRHSYETWVVRCEAIENSFGMYDSNYDASVVAPRALRQWLLHPLWSFCCADEEAANYLRATEPDYQSLRGVVEHRSACQLTNDLARAHRDYRPPFAKWRFYTAIPFLDFPDDAQGYPYAPFNRAWQHTMKNLTVNEMVIAAIAIKRYELVHGQLPQDLNALGAEFVRNPPRDFMDGQALRYRKLNSGSFSLYSVGDDAKDDRGDGSPLAFESHAQTPWSARDCVWPITLE
jgi:hypothetical protein